VYGSQGRRGADPVLRMIGRCCQPGVSRPAKRR